MKRTSVLEFYNQAVKRMAATVVISGSLFFFIVLLLQYNEKRVILSQQANSISKAVRSDMLSGNTSYVYEVCRSIFSEHSIDKLKIRDNTTLYCNLKKNEGSLILVSLSAPILFNPKGDMNRENTLGWVDLEIDATTIALSLLLSFLSLLTIIWIFLKTSKQMHRVISADLVQPLTDFSKIMTENSRDLEAVTNLKNQPLFDEINEVVVSYSDLVSKLDATEVQLLHESKRAALADISQQVAHDIRSPLSALKIAVSRISSNTPEHQLIQQASERIDSISKDLLFRANSNSEATQKNTKPHSKNCDLSEVLKKIIAEKLLLYPTAVIECDPVLEMASQIAIVGNSIEVERMLSNIINNALEACDSLPQIQISIRIYEHKVGVVVTDNGRGIPEEILASLGQRGFTYGKTNGSGLGLFHAKQCMEALQGSFNIQSKVGIGTMITLTFIRY